MATQPVEARCARCQQRRVVHPASPAWGHAPTPLCTHCWQQYADARAAGDYVDWPDALRNADDDQLTRALTTEETTQ
ncbi:hypothetical protein [Streptomyces sp. LS1784]|uniref:hypothetical protein n=1 Tax=Streptomyces sp. LS1784 TaxID=2851533 RepID=UPI001CCA068C|nr:hypothetical protein [Streptomyces sp. LS1784]